MLFYTQFVWSTFFGSSVGWGRQKRSDGDGPSWAQCVAAHSVHTLLAIAAAILVARLLPVMFPWLLLVLTGPIVAIPFSYAIASSRFGAFCRRHGWFLIPEEAAPPKELLALETPAEASVADSPAPGSGEDLGLTRALLDPRLNAIHVSLLRERKQVSLHAHDYLNSLGNRLLQEGPATLPPAEKKILLWDPDTMQALHQILWSGTSPQRHEWWLNAFAEYNRNLTANSVPG